MSKKSVFMIAVIVVLANLLCVRLGLAIRSVGVEAGDWAEYTVIWSGNGTLPDPHYRTTSVRMTVKDVSGLNVTFEAFSFMADGSSQNSTYVLNVETGQGTVGATIWFIAADLNGGDLLYTEHFMYGTVNLLGSYINETTYRDIMGQTVQVNHWNTTFPYPYPETLTSFDVYWFQATGMLAELTMYQSWQGVSPLITVSNGIVTTWVKAEARIIDIIPEFSPLQILPLFITATLLAALVYGRKI
jgi:hypothetical protein